MKKSKFSTWWRKSKVRMFFLNYRVWKLNITKVKYIFITYLLTVIIATLFLLSPWTHKNSNEKISFWDALFTTASSFSDTGLLRKPTYNTWNMFGQAIIAVLIFLGGLGIFAFRIFLINLIFFKRRNSLSEIEVVSHERGSGESGQTKKLIMDSIGTLLIIWIVFSFGLTFYFYFNAPKANTTNYGDYISPYKNWSLSFRYGFFHCVSALNNAGFDIIGNSSLKPYYHNIGLQFLFLLLLITGGLGYPVIHDILNYFRFLIKYKGKRRYQWRLFTKISLLTYFLTTLIAFILIFSFEASVRQDKYFWRSSDINLGNKWERAWALLFTTFSTRSAGFSTIDFSKLSSTSLVICSILMFIGAAPASTGGGIRTTTMAILFLSLLSKIMGRPTVRAFRRRIEDETVKMSSIVFSISIFLVLIFSFITMSSFDKYGGKIPSEKFSFIHIFFEVNSAFGTAGLSCGITPNLNNASIVFLSILMFIGQFGISSTILVWGKKKNYSNKYEYISEPVVIG
ncbi:potassium-transporting ATPase subunit KdpA [Mycoplasmopsis caviae]|uniref:Ktr system potassium uptake protein B n=1 Tax=Mycoplasmopsis caviae TaxID=55603 RepID=A0A3P8MDZ2_9BACT|nr:potassium transporter TrkG [Mycoplasmopsis caviae]UUD34723.1 potassium-transporting ATPase subunit KdpA [Mycoplasmopsis caviae]VDR42420.1 Ktr system potassium uptake protein B [Mycoplasmopsis caviae]